MLHTTRILESVLLKSHFLCITNAVYCGATVVAIALDYYLFHVYFINILWNVNKLRNYSLKIFRRSTEINKVNCIKKWVSQFPADLVTFTEEIILLCSGTFHTLCRGKLHNSTLKNGQGFWKADTIKTQFPKLVSRMFYSARYSFFRYRIFHVE